MAATSNTVDTRSSSDCEDFTGRNNSNGNAMLKLERENAMFPKYQEKPQGFGNGRMSRERKKWEEKGWFECAYCTNWYKTRNILYQHKSQCPNLLASQKSIAQFDDAFDKKTEKISTAVVYEKNAKGPKPGGSRIVTFVHGIGPRAATVGNHNHDE